MGQRHQAFLIARVVPHGQTQPKYRCIAAYHHQWCYGTLPLRAARRCMTLVKQKENAEIIREEIHAIDGKYGTFEDDDPEIPAVPCPFTAALLSMSWDVDLTENLSYISGVSFDNNILHAGMGSWGGDNNDGITIIDVTNPEDPAYCFVNNDHPLTGVQYIKGYYDIPVKKPEELEGMERSIVECVADLKGERLVAIEALREAWPDEYPIHKKAKKSKDASTGPEHGADSAGDATLPVPSLTNMSLRTAILQGLEAGDTSGVEEMLWLPAKAPIVREVLKQQSPFPDSGISLLQQLVKQNLSASSTLDLSGFDLSEAQVLEVTRDCATLWSLNLSRIPRITVSAVRELLTQLPKLKRLVLMSCPGIPSADIVKLVSASPELFFNLEALMHPAFFALRPPADERWEPAISFVSKHDMMAPGLGGVSLPLCSPENVVQGLIDFLTSLPKQGSSFNFSGGNGTAAAFTTAVRPPEKSWYERSIVAMPRLDLRLVSQERGGWIFMISMGSFMGENGWAFVRLPRGPGSQRGKDASGEEGEEKDGDEGIEVHDFRGFLKALTEEGRPEVPEEMVVRADEFFKKMGEPADPPSIRERPTTMFTREAALNCLHEVDQGRRMMAYREQQEW